MVLDGNYSVKHPIAKEMTITMGNLPVTITVPDSGEVSEEHNKAIRANQGKINYTLIPAAAQTEEAKVWMFGEGKYGRDNWRKLWGSETTNVVLASLLRHALAIQQGEVSDPESGLSHAAHIRANAAMLIEHYSNLGLLGLGEGKE